MNLIFGNSIVGKQPVPRKPLDTYLVGGWLNVYPNHVEIFQTLPVAQKNRQEGYLITIRRTFKVELSPIEKVLL